MKCLDDFRQKEILENLKRHFFPTVLVLQDADLAEQRGGNPNGEGRLSITNNIGTTSYFL
jgi:hypothetical protein